MRFVLFLFFLLSFFISSNANDYYSLDLSNNNNFEGYEIIEKELQGVEIVLLGEGLHNYNVDLYSKLKLIRYLIEEMEFDILLLEQSFQDLWYLNDAFNRTNISIEESLFLHYNSFLSKGLYEIFSYVYLSKKKGINIDVGGIDIWTFHDNMVNHFLNFLPKNNSKYNKDENLRYIFHTMRFNYNDNDPNLISSLEYLDSMSCNYLFFNNDSLNHLWYQMYLNFQYSNYYKSKMRDIKYPLFSSNVKKTYLNQIDDYRIRDSIMALNVEFYKKLYPNRKIIVFTSTYHIRKCNLPFEKKPLIGNNTNSMGKIISKKYQSYHIAWIYPKIKINQKKRYNRSRNSLEIFLHKTKKESGFIPLKTFTMKGDSLFTMYPIWNFKTHGYWANSFDAVMFYDTTCIYTGKDYENSCHNCIEREYFFD